MGAVCTVQPLAGTVTVFFKSPQPCLSTNLSSATMRGSSVLVSLSLVNLSHQFSHGYRYGHGWASYGAPLNANFFSRSPTPVGWRDSWKPVEDGPLGQYPGGKWLVDGAPPEKLQVSWPNNVRITETNSTVSTGLMSVKPTLSWPVEPGVLYTVMVVGLFDLGLPPSARPQVYIHWLVTNIPGNSIEMGTEVFDYIKPFALKLDTDKNIVKDAEQLNHPILLMVYRQPSRIVMEESQAGCTPDVAEPRVTDYRNLATKYGLQLVAGNYLQVPWSGFHTQQMLCRMSRCVQKPFPFPISDVNTMPECQARQDIVDFTLLGPKVAKRKEYAKIRSQFSLNSVTSQIRNTFPTFSTGEIADFTAIMGAYNGAPLGTNNQAQTLEGVVDLTILGYQNLEATQKLFQSAGDFDPTGGVGGDLKIILTKPEDQEFDFMALTKDPASVFQVNIVKVKEGRMEEFLTLRDKVIAKSRSSRNVGRITKFEVDQEVLEGVKGTQLYFNSTDNAVTLLEYNGLAQAQRFTAELRRDPDFKKFTSTFDCIVCAFMTNNLHSTYYPPFN